MKSPDRHIPIIGFDGNHRVGKGTQLDLMGTFLADLGIHPIILRGDGSRPGLGGEGDPESVWWQNFKQFVAEHDNEYDAWRIGARVLLGEAACVLDALNHHATTVLLFDRTRISRMQMTIKEGLPLDNETLYRNDGKDKLCDEVLLGLEPDLTIYMRAPTSVLLGRLSLRDPKYEFRRANIVSSQVSYDEALEAYISRGGNAIAVRADQDPVDITRAVKDAIMAEQLL